jgi:DNA-binding XRE family transcriptional regulator
MVDASLPAMRFKASCGRAQPSTDHPRESGDPEFFSVGDSRQRSTSRPKTQKLLGHVPILVSSVPVTLRARRPEFWCEQGDPLPAQLRARRRGLGLNTAAAAALVGVTQWTFGLWENGRRRPSAQKLRAIAKFLGRRP